MILVGDCLEQMKTMPDASVDSIVTDPPYGWRFMGKAWDRFDIDKKAEQGKRPGETYIGKDGVTRKTRNLTAESAGKYDNGLEANRAFQAFTEGWAREAFRVLKPGGHMLVFCGPRTYHRMAAGVEDAGFEIRDQLQWLFGSGFPKSLDVSKAMDKAAGAEREVVPRIRLGDKAAYSGNIANGITLNKASTDAGNTLGSAVTDLAKQWSGWGTALKPANEPIVLARKPLIGTVASNVAEHGTGALNIDASRIGEQNALVKHASNADAKKTMGTFEEWDGSYHTETRGRWPSNCLFDEEAAEALDAQSGMLAGRGSVLQDAERGKADGVTFGLTSRPQQKQLNLGGGASRFFYVAKASKRERNAGLEGMPDVTARSGMGGTMPVDDDGNDRDRFSVTQKNHHPTVKPIALMEYLVRLITPPGGTVLDPFAGSGTTGCACAKLGFQFIGIEMEPEYAAIAEKRIAHWGEAE